MPAALILGPIPSLRGPSLRHRVKRGGSEKAREAGYNGRAPLRGLLQRPFASGGSRAFSLRDRVLREPRDPQPLI